MSEVNKPAMNDSDSECYFNPDWYKCNHVVARVGSFPWALIQLQLGKKVRRRNWAVQEYLNFVPRKIKADGQYDYLSHIDEYDAKGNFRPWQPTQEDMMACNWELSYLLVFDLTLGVGTYKNNNKHTGWGYSAAGSDNPWEASFGALNLLQNNTEVGEILEFNFDNEGYLTWRVSYAKNEEMRQKLYVLLKKLAITMYIDDIKYFFGGNSPYKYWISDDGEIRASYTYYDDKEKLISLFNQPEKTKRVYFKLYVN
ncbi:DUF2829 domain-containing protein [Xenorhabdus sp. 12]|uniref:DUF2829 domain-containing protein n=1 Tax=Xenorhabdus santafensis TaxID=2582833 RepID=A0ABU4SD06_9GAMM|nr:DUF2829 domain-containing protein [Xenorhabdus sp. 12]MDX7988644.1 DUF2829 domain-containing protein [Xenorhabdus sp. 12]